MDTVLSPAPPVLLPIAGSAEHFPVRRIYCVGRNYADHAREMGGDPNREPPFFFLKSASCALAHGGDFPFPARSQDVHHEIELVVALGKGGTDIAVETALTHVWGYAAGLDMTRRDLQAECKKLGRPWEIAKSFEHSAPIGPLVPSSRCGHPAKGAITLTVNGETRQSGDIADMIWSVPEIIAHLSGYFELAAGDLIMTGTPAGVGRVVRGDAMAGAIAGIGEVRARVV